MCILQTPATALIFTLRFGFLYKAAETNCSQRLQKIIYCKTARKQNKQTNKKPHEAFLLFTSFLQTHLL